MSDIIHTNSDFRKKVALITPMYQRMAQDGEAGIKSTVRNLEALAEQSYNVYLVEDGSKDGSQQWLEDYVQQNNSKINVILRPENGQKVGAIRDAVAALPEDSKYVLLTDDDTVVLNPENIEDVVNMIEEQGHAGSALKVVPSEVRKSDFNTGHKFKDGLKYIRAKFLNTLQDVDYSQSRVWAAYTVSPKLGVDAKSAKVRCIAGAGGVWKRDVLEEALKSHSGRHNGDDMELTAIIMDNGNSVTYTDKVIFETEVPKRYSDLLKQRKRWELGALETFAKEHKFYLREMKKWLVGTIKNPRKNFGKHRLAQTTLYEWSVWASVPFVMYSTFDAIKSGDENFMKNYYMIDTAYNGVFLGLAIKQKEVRSTKEALATLPAMMAYRALVTFPTKIGAIGKFIKNSVLNRYKTKSEHKVNIPTVLSSSVIVDED
jgi:cellulose synthase/poly-beta-1,6-N-acetylglucosamine synthase-like glycosyltransferase